MKFRHEGKVYELSGAEWNALWIRMWWDLAQTAQVLGISYDELYAMGTNRLVRKLAVKLNVARETAPSPAAGPKVQKQYEIAADGNSITCLTCLRTSYNGNDVAHRYCGWCHKFHEGAQMGLGLL